MHKTLVGLSGGDVVACGASLFVVHDVTEAGMTVLRIVRQGEPRSRADVRPDWSDLAEAGVPFGDVAVRCMPIARGSAHGFARLGRVSCALRRRCGEALSRERAVRRFEGTPGLRSTLVAFEGAGSRGRRIGRQNAT